MVISLIYTITLTFRHLGIFLSISIIDLIIRALGHAAYTKFIRPIYNIDYVNLIHTGSQHSTECTIWFFLG